MYKPKDLPPGIHPAHIWAHGGGGIMTTADMYATYMQKNCLNARCICFVPDFRNAPEFKSIIGMKDIYHTIKHIYELSDSYSVDKRRICLGGRSGGAYLTLGAALMLVRNGEAHMAKAMFLSAPMLSDILLDVSPNELKDHEKEPSRK